MTPNQKNIFSLYSKLNSYSLVAKKLNISKQRVHQVIKNYKNFGRQSRTKIYKFFKETCELCNINESTNFHHKDGNNYNEDPKNLISLCWTCHQQEHKKLRNGKGYYGYTNCKGCKKVFTARFKHDSKGYCKTCYSNFKRNNSQYIPIIRPTHCIKCKSALKNFSSNKMCQKCYCYERYHNITSVRQKHLESLKKYYNKRKTLKLNFASIQEYSL